CRIETVALRIHVHQHRQSVGKQNSAGRGNKREIGHDHLITGPDVQRSHGDLQCRGSVGDRDSMAGAVEFSKGFFKLQSPGPWGTPPHATFKNFLERAALPVVVLRPEWKWPLFRFFAAEQSEFRHGLSLNKTLWQSSKVPQKSGTVIAF